MATTGRDVGMYRLSLTMLWIGATAFGVAAALDAVIDFMKNAQGLLLAGWAMCFVGAILHAGLHRLNETAQANGRRSEQLAAAVDQKTKQVRGDVDQIRCQVKEVRDLTKAGSLINKMHQPPPPEPEPETDAIIYQFTLRGKDGADVIVGSRTSDPIAEDEIYAALEENYTGTLPGRLRSS